MWISDSRHVYRVCGIRLHPTGVFSNVLMQNKRNVNRKTSDWSKVIVRYMEDTDSDILGLGLGLGFLTTKTSDLSKSDCSLHDICQQRYLVYYESYRDEIVQGRVESETASFEKI